ncbi:MAG: hypothetical protein KZQ60_17400, partial [Candidatus Thiodiazotropha sp. (ex Lucinoma aequizonata)]|nr:hypothetical protein [Candidatus Thiodiazotropha sp. (ex Lucinoma aequizonata)]
LGCALCMPFISPFRSPFRPYNRAYAYRELTAFAPLSMAVSGRLFQRIFSNIFSTIRYSQLASHLLFPVIVETQVFSHPRLKPTK